MRVGDAIWTDPDRMGGVPCFRGTRVPVVMLLENIEDGLTLEGFLSEYPPVTREQALADLHKAQEAILARVAAA